MSALVNPAIIRAYDIRGVYGHALKDDDATALGKALVSAVIQKNKRAHGIIVVGRDARLSSVALADALTRALIEGGMAVIDIGVVVTPMSYFVSKMLAADVSVMITGSHNPKLHNGFKISFNNAPLYGKELKDLLSKKPTAHKGEGSRISLMSDEAYVNKIIGSCAAVADKIKIAWDAGNGSAGIPLKTLLTKMGGRHQTLFMEPDGNFPNRPPDPSDANNLTAIRETVVSKDCSVGFAFDGDADRLVVIDDKGEVMRGDEILILLTEDLMHSKKDVVVLCDVKCGRAFFERVRQLGGKALMSATGHALMKVALKECKGDLAGELSGHYFFSHNYFGFDDALYGACRVIEFLAREGCKLSEWRAKLPQYVSTNEVRLPIEEYDKSAVMGSLTSYLATLEREVITIDGVRVETDDGWWGVRVSNTESLLTLRAEAKDPDSLKSKVREMIRSLSICGYEAKESDILGK